jgi:hypothetical protein
MSPLKSSADCHLHQQLPCVDGETFHAVNVAWTGPDRDKSMDGSAAPQIQRIDA